jgi:predicted protein tyrosine phosphatase
MSSVYVCPLSQVPYAVRTVRPSHLITLLDPKDVIPTPEGIDPNRHLRLGINDIVDPHPDYVVPEDHHVERIVGFIRTWDGREPMLIHCWAGISRSTATAFIALCMRNSPGREGAIAKSMRAHAPHVHPNKRIVAYADAILGRKGAMVEAVERLGPGRIVYEGVLFGVPIKFDDADHE